MTGRDAPPASAADGAPSSAPASAGAGAPVSTARGGWRAWAELLRAPLLLSPIADVMAGFGSAQHGLESWTTSHYVPDAFTLAVAGSRPDLARACAAGICLLAAGMAQNALADLEDDRRRKPNRPLPRGALRAASVWIVWAALSAAGLLLAAATGRSTLLLAAGIVALTAAYHYGLKRWRVPGCLALGALRGFDLLLGASVLQAWLATAQLRDGRGEVAPMSWNLPLGLAVLYALFMTGASLHASTDDEPPSGAAARASRLGVRLQLGVLVLTGLRLLMAFDATARGLLVALLVLLWAFVRVLRGVQTLPPGPLTGVLLSGAYLLNAAVCYAQPSGTHALATGTLLLLLFGASRLMKRAFPPT